MKITKYLIIFSLFLFTSAIAKPVKGIDFREYKVNYYFYGQFVGDFKGQYKNYGGFEAHGDLKEIVKLRKDLKKDGRILNYQKIRKSAYFEEKYSVYFVFVN